MMTSIEKRAELMGCLRDYQLWVREGMPKYRDEQYYYDDYHNHISHVVGMDGHYTFAIQLSDSSDGDVWWKGEFRRINGGTDVEIIREGSRRS